MAKFSTKRKSSRTSTVNVAGGKAYKETSKLEFVSTLLTSFLGDKFYESENETLDRIINLIESIPDKRFVAKTAIYARNVFGMRSVSHAVAGEIARLVKGEVWTKNFFDKVVHRPDDITEIVAYYLSNYEKPLPNSLKKGLGLALGKFDSYAIAKYRGESNEFSLVDIVNLIHPRPTEKNSEALKQLVDGTLKSKDTWEREISDAGQKGKTDEEKAQLKKESWTRLIKEKKIGYFALLRNLRNIIEQAPEMIDEAIVLLTDENLIKKSLVLPFRFTTALTEIEAINGTEARKVIKALNKAVDIACKNAPKLEGDTLVVLDTSGSMNGRPIEIGSLFSAVLVKSNDADFMMFSDNANYLTLNSNDSVITICNSIRSKMRMSGTNFHAIFETANKKYDRIIILSDMQDWMTDNLGNSGAPTSIFAKYKREYNANPKVFSFNLNDYGQIMFPEKNVYCLAGFSEKVFDIIKLLETDKDALISEIEKIEL